MEKSAPKDITQVMQKYQEDRERMRLLKRVRLGMSVMLALVIVGYLWVLFGKARSQYQPEKFEGPMNAEAKRLEKPLQTAALTSIRKLQPIYAAHAKRSLQKIEPQLKSVAAKELRTVGHSLKDNMTTQLRASLTRIYNRQYEELGKHFPKLTDYQRKELFRKRLENDLRTDVDALVVEFEKMYMRDIKGVEKTVYQFRPNRFDQFNQEELGCYFVHLWIMMLDQQLMKGKEVSNNG